MACYRKTAGGILHHLPCAVPVELDAMNNSGSSSSMEACRRKTINAAIAGSLCQGEAKSGCGPIPTFYPMSFFKLFLISSRERATATDLFIAVMQTEQAVRRKVGANEGAKARFVLIPSAGIWARVARSTSRAWGVASAVMHRTGSHAALGERRKMLLRQKAQPQKARQQSLARKRSRGQVALPGLLIVLLATPSFCFRRGKALSAPKGAGSPPI